MSILLRSVDYGVYVCVCVSHTDECSQYQWCACSGYLQYTRRVSCGARTGQWGGVG